MENKIKVTVEYKIPTTSKFDALMKEYEAAKKYADEMVVYYKPLADVAEEAKFNAVLEQLEVIKEYAKRINSITKNDSTFVSTWVYNRRLDVIYCPKSTQYKYEIKWGGEPFTIQRARKDRHLFFGKCGVITNWEKYEVYKGLEEEAFELIQDAIDEQKTRANYQKERLHNIINGGV